jgi:crossover junction endodeoxyribonuclease RuvC
MTGSTFFVAGVDVSTKTGLVVLDSAGEVRDSRELSLSPIPANSGPGPRIQRLMALRNSLRECFPSLPRLRLVAIEGYSFASRFNNVFLVELGCAVRCMLYESGIPFVEVSPSSVKKFATGLGRGDKSLVRVGVYKRWRFEHPSDNVVDAYVLARIASAACGVGKVLDCERDILGRLKRSLPA